MTVPSRPVPVQGIRFQIGSKKRLVLPSPEFLLCRNRRVQACDKVSVNGSRAHALVASQTKNNCDVRWPYLDSLNKGADHLTRDGPICVSSTALRRIAALGKCNIPTPSCIASECSKPPFVGPRHVLQYLARCTHRPAISIPLYGRFRRHTRRVSLEGLAHHSKRRTTNLSHEEFLPRFLQQFSRRPPAHS